MNKSVYFLLALLLLVSGVFAKKTIIISNSLNISRNAEIVEINLSTLKVSFESKSWILKNEKGKEVGYQLIYNSNKKPVSFIFQTDVKANGSVSYTLYEGKPAPVKVKTFARFVPERKDDLAWENDLAAYRMYGPALAKENPSNGVDLWLKCTDDLVIDKRYKDELQNGLSYHIDRGNGLDCYTVGHTLGVGGIAPYTSDSLWIGNHYDHYQVLENGPLRSVFTLTYDSVKVENSYLKQEITITTSAGSMLNKAVVKYSGAPQKIELASGIFLHDGKGNLKEDAANGTIAYAEDAISNAKLPSGRNYIGVYIPVKVNIVKKQVSHALISANYNVGEQFTYYFGGGWNKWGYPSDEDWFKAINNFKKSTEKPFIISIK
jgi:hypothetical protein